MSSARSPFRAVLAGAAITVVATASLVAGATVANAAPSAPTITSPTSDSAFTTTTITVSGSLADFLNQEVTVRVDDDGSVTTGCTDIVDYFEDTFTCDVVVPGPGKYELTATSVDTLDPELIVSPVSNAVTVIVGNTNPALLGYSESGT
ncbi:MAG: hypothetical protein Q7J04_09700, partial [Microcella sp.]|nr:hypothetical protein [Microcella sp.]